MPENKIKVYKKIEFFLSETKQVCLSIVSSTDGKKYLDIRQFYRAESGEFLPTQKGIWIPLEDSEASAKRILFEGLKFLGVDRKEIALFFEEDDELGELNKEISDEDIINSLEDGE